MKRNGVKTGLKLYNMITIRDTVAIIMQLRTGHCGLDYCLHRSGIKNMSKIPRTKNETLKGSKNQENDGAETVRIPTNIEHSNENIRVII